MWTILLVVHKVRKKVLNFIKSSKTDFQRQVSLSENGAPVIQNV